MTVDTELPNPNIKTKKFDPILEKEGLSLGLHPVIARVLASRTFPEGFSMVEALSPKLKNLFSPFKMIQMEKAANRVAKAIMEGETIGIETDHDCDGQTSHAVLHHNLLEVFKHPRDKIRSYIGHRLTEGYGLSEPVATRILEDTHKASLIITADNGSSDEPRIARLKQAGIDIIVTDHHQIPKEGIPKSAYACLNPTRKDCGYEDPSVAGCMVAWLLMAATRQKLITQGYLPKNTPSLSDSLDFVAVGTVADCVSIARSMNNRIVIAYGLRLIEEGRRPCWRAIKTTLSKPLSSEDLGFRIGPLLNSDGRLGDAFGSVHFLLSETDEEAMALMFALEEHNANRKKIQQDIVLQGLQVAKKQYARGQYSLSLYLEEGHTGVHGIAASRLKELFGRPTVFLAPKVGVPDVISGSVRGTNDFHVSDALQNIANQHPDLFIAFGGHKGAGGITLKLEDFDLFSKAFEEAVRLQLREIDLGPIVWTEGVLGAEEINLALIEALEKLEPFGREFEYPIFELDATIEAIRFIGDGTHARIIIKSKGISLKGVWFKCRQSQESPLAFKVTDRVNVAFTPKINIFRNQRSVDVQVVCMKKND